MVYDFHIHTSLSDGALSPIEMVRWAYVKGYRAIALTDHVGIGSLSRIIKEVAEDCALARGYWDIIAIPGVELTHIPAGAIAEVAWQAKEMGAWVVVVHGETITEPVEKGTNMAAASSPHVDILAHPGLLTIEEATTAAENKVFIEITAKRSHSFTNTHIASVARKATAKLLVNSDAHDESELLTLPSAYAIARGAGSNEKEINEILEINPRALLERLPLKTGSC